MREYRDHFVAFLDILGFKALLHQSKCDDIFSIFQVIHEHTKSSLVYNGVQIQAYEHINHMILSDSIILFVDASIEDSFAALIDVCDKLQKYLANRAQPILLRGGIVRGGLYYEGDIIYGDGLTKAYLLESNLAKYPRIVFTKETLEAGKNITNHMFLDFEPIRQKYTIDEDELFFINYRPDLTWIASLKLEFWKGYFDRLLHLCDVTLNSATDASLREKYLWLRKWILKSIKMFPTLQEMYETEKKEKNKRNQQQISEKLARYASSDKVADTLTE